MRNGVRQGDCLSVDPEGSGAGVRPDDSADSKGALGAVSKPCLCEVLRPILRRVNPRVLGTPPASEFEYGRLAALPDELRTLEEERQMLDYLLVHLRGDRPYPLLPSSKFSQRLEGLAAWKIHEEQHVLWLAAGAVPRDNPHAFECELLEWPEWRFALENPFVEPTTV